MGCARQYDSSFPVASGVRSVVRKFFKAAFVFFPIQLSNAHCAGFGCGFFRQMQFPKFVATQRLRPCHEVKKSGAILPETNQLGF
jgi:hypothetical protein